MFTRRFYCKARANKSKDKPDSELNEFEQVTTLVNSYERF